MSLQVVFTGTPEAFAAQQRQYKEDEKKAEDERRAIAKARAARYNLTLRAKDLKKAREEPVEQKKESLRKSLNRRLSQLSGAFRRGSSKDAKGNEDRVVEESDDIEKEKDEDQAEEEEKKEVKEEKEEEEDDDDEEDDVLWMGDLAKVLEEQKADQINVAILAAFFSEVAPERVDEVEDLLSKNQGREEELFEELAEQYPSKPMPTAAGDDDSDDDNLSAIPDDARDEEDDAGYILSIMEDSSGKWAANVQGHVLKQRMLKAGATQQDVDAVLNNQSEMF